MKLLNLSLLSFSFAVAELQNPTWLAQHTETNSETKVKWLLGAKQKARMIYESI